MKRGIDPQKDDGFSVAGTVWSPFGWGIGWVIAGDEFTPDGCRVWDAEPRKNLDKARFRHGLGGVIESYEEVALRLGVELNVTKIQ